MQNLLIDGDFLSKLLMHQLFTERLRQEIRVQLVQLNPEHIDPPMQKLQSFQEEQEWKRVAKWQLNSIVSEISTLLIENSGEEIARQSLAWHETFQSMQLEINRMKEKINIETISTQICDISLTYDNFNTPRKESDTEAETSNNDQSFESAIRKQINQLDDKLDLIHSQIPAQSTLHFQKIELLTNQKLQKIGKTINHVLEKLNDTQEKLKEVIQKRQKEKTNLENKQNLNKLERIRSEKSFKSFFGGLIS